MICIVHETYGSFMKVPVPYLQVVFELESLATVDTLESAEDGGFVMGNHVALQTVHVRKLFSAHLALLQTS
jgi:hypothetical protein